MDKGTDGRFMVLRSAGGGKRRESEGQVRSRRHSSRVPEPKSCSYVRCQSQESRGQDHDVRTQADGSLQVLLLSRAAL